MKKGNDLGQDSIVRLVFKIAIPSMLAQFVNVLYSIVDRIFVGNIPGGEDVALAGVGVCGPIVTMISAFAFLIGVGGAPLLGIALGEGKKARAENIMANCFMMLCGTAVLVTGLALALRRPMLMLFGASQITFPYANAYFTVYVSGTIFALLSVGMYQFVVAQGYAKEGMCSVMLGAVLNILLDPLFIFVFHMGVRGAALATVISQAASASFILIFLLRRAEVPITFGGYRMDIMGKVLQLGASPFIIVALDNLMIIAMNALLQKYGGAQSDTLITVNTIVQSFMLVVTMPLGGITGGTQCILSYNFGAGSTQRVIKAQKYLVGLCMAYTAVLFVLARLVGPVFVSLFTSDASLNAQACWAIRVCTLGIIPLAVQYEVVDGFTAMGQVQLALPLSFWRKCLYFVAIFIIPLFADASAIFYAQPISDFGSVVVSAGVYLLVIRKILQKRERVLAQAHAADGGQNGTVG